jgi:antitoxin ChpS
MITSKLRKVGGSVMLAVPSAILDMVQLQSGSTVSITEENERRVIEPERSKQYSLNDLLARCDPSASATDEDARWTASAPRGRELV